MPASREVLARSILEVLAEIRAQPVEELAAEIQAVGSDTASVSSHEVVAILVVLEPATGIDPSNPSVLKGCNVQSFQQLIEFVDRAGKP